jgi:hypothetical protein
MNESRSKRDLSSSLGVSYFVHPLPLLAVCVLIFNDHYLKRAYPSWLTGKLSDFAGLFFFPIFLCALWNLASNLFSNPSRIRWLTFRQALIAVAVTDLIFVSVKFMPEVTQLYLTAMTSLGYPSAVTVDRTDLIALAVNLLTLWYAKIQAEVA